MQVHPLSDEGQIRKHQVSCSSCSKDSWLPLQDSSVQKDCRMCLKMLAENSSPRCCPGYQHWRAFGLSFLQNQQNVKKYMNMVIRLTGVNFKSKADHSQKQSCSLQQEFYQMQKQNGCELSFPTPTEQLSLFQFPEIK